MTDGTGPLPVRRRHVARVFVVDVDGRVLLLHDHDTVHPDRPRFWLTPGGGIEPGETAAAAAAREVWEETGLEVAPEALGSVVARRRVRHAFAEQVLDQDEEFFLLRVPAYDPAAGALTVGETASLLGTRWWTAADLRRTHDDVWPRGLATLLPLLLAGEPVVLPDGDENPGG